MDIKTGLSQGLQLQLNMTLALQQSIKILQFSGNELLDYLQEEVKENPFLEGFPRDQGRGVDPYLLENIVYKESNFLEDLLHQVSFLKLAPLEKKVLHYLIGNLNERGFLTLTVAEVVEQLDVSEAVVEKMVHQLQQLDPPGVGAFNVTHSLILQARRKNLDPRIEIILLQYLEALAEQDYEWIGKELNIPLHLVKQFAREISSLNPYPCTQLSSSRESYIIPDVYLYEVEGEWVVEINEERNPLLKINDYYQGMMRQGKWDAGTKDYLRERFQAARWIIRSLVQRRLTLERVTLAVAEAQRSFFHFGVSGLQPLTLKEIGDQLGLHESTISRAVKGKYVHTPKGLFELRYFFNRGFSTLAIKTRIKEIIEREDKKKPYSDQQLTRFLQGEGFALSRRTVAKYREELGIPSSTKRKIR